MISSKQLALFALSLALSGCVSAQATMLGGTRYAPVPENEVHVFLEETEVPETCERIALIHTAGDVESTSKQQMISAARRRAGKVGANAVLVTDIRDPKMGTRVAATVFGISAERKGEMYGYRCPEGGVVAAGAGSLAQ
jgi:hypothetical protein